VAYADGPAGPSTVFVKAVDPDHKFLIKLTSGLLHEPRLFNSNIELPLEHPLVYTAVIDEADDRRTGGERSARTRPDARPVLG
jgi:hypothetical protein